MSCRAVSDERLSPDDWRQLVRTEECFGVFGIERPELNGASTVAPIVATDTRADQ